ncbi:uncharacterized protein LOC113874434 [Abrus precatorius]|uniref:Uncharacterized protein LOC113874434 n=1 Tax=Abrus precatorius TaxID=3816 RepID=A0A8B8MLH4_ABRPR|nr:uncharacterized protein LOC113874434 [Abrus precatorius]
MRLTLYLIMLIHTCIVVFAIKNNVTLPKFSSILVFGDSQVDTGNNNYINTLVKANHLPYGKDFPGHIPTGRFSNGKLVPDFLASILNIKDTVPPFLEPNLSNKELLTGVTFASAGSGFDEVTSAPLKTISMFKQIEYFKAYIAKLKYIVGENETKWILENALLVVCVGPNDFIFNFYDLPLRSLMFSMDKYQDYLLDKLQIFVKVLYDLGCRKIGVAGLPPIGCLPIQITVKLGRGRQCIESENSDSELYNKKLMQILPQVQAMLPGSRVVYADLYYFTLDLVHQPGKYGILVTNDGCCGSGLIEVSPFCNEFTPVCDDPSKYIFWDSVHFSEASYLYLAKHIEKDVLPQFNSYLILPCIKVKAMTYTIHFIVMMQVCTIVAAASNDLMRLNFSSILVFGDSTVDTGNNNYINTLAKGNHLPYGKDFPGHVASGRFSNGKLVPDFIASTLNLKDTVPPFLDPKLSNEELLTGVSFASGGSGFDDLTTVLSGAISVSKQIKYFKEYVSKLKRIAGENEAKRILGNALVIISAGTNDFLFNFYDIPIRKLEFNMSGYQDYVQNRLRIFIKELYDLGCRKFAVTGLPPIGCIPLQITAKFSFSKDRKCVAKENSDAKLYNRKLSQRLLQFQAMLPGSRVVYTDLYEPCINLINHPQKYGFKESSRGCCGTGLFEVTPFCNEITPICDDASKYVFWDSVHPTEAAYQYFAKYIQMEVLPKFQHDAYYIL